jgi:hypothetical protein
MTSSSSRAHPMTAASETVLLDALVRIDSVNPGLDPAGAGEAQAAAFVAGWDGTPGCVSRNSGAIPAGPASSCVAAVTGAAAGCSCAATSTSSAWLPPPVAWNPAFMGTVSTPGA